MSMVNVMAKILEWYPEKSATFENDNEVTKILDHLKKHKLVTIEGDAPYARIATTKLGAEIAEKYFVVTARRKEIERIKRELNDKIPSGENVALKEVAQYLLISMHPHHISSF